ncbi:MAG: hypothetical protein HYR83_06060, partial [Planctomycetes bacterium]|nr:hypothetical protein [Planctomycetota bacterium]
QAARLARQVIAGEYFRMRDLFDQKVYPQRIELFYEQSAIIVLYLFEAGPEAMHAFLTELAAGHSHDAACAAALGIPEEGAVEEFERRWVEWMRRRYVKDLDITKDKTVESSADKTTNSLALPWVNEVDTVSSLTNWRDVDTSSLAGFKVLGDNPDSAWSVKSGILSSTAQPGQGASLLGIRMNESAPVAVTCDVTFLGSPVGASNRFGFAQVDAAGFDTRIEATAPLRDTSSHKVIAVWTDDLAIYVDDVCQGRYAAQTIKGNAQDVDYPLALVSYGPVEVKNLRVASINAFSSKPVVAANDSKSPDQPASQEGTRSSRRRGQDSKGP